MEIVQKKEFRIQYKKWAVTYSQCPISKEKMVEFLQTSFRGLGLRSYAVGQEHHKDGNLHLHVYIELDNKPDIRNERFLDIKDLGVDYHPNIKPCRSEEDWIYYLMKEDKSAIVQRELFSTPKDFRKRKADLDSWTLYNSVQKLTTPYPFELPNGTIVNEPLPAEKKCNYWIHGEATVGKTLWLNDQFGGRGIYMRVKSDYPYDDWDSNLQRIIIFDDVYSDLNELLYMSNCFRILAPVYGNTRYNKRYMPENKRCTIIILSNRTPEETFWSDETRFNSDQKRRLAFYERFNVMKYED